MSHRFVKRWDQGVVLTTTVRAADAFVAGVRVLDTRKERRDPTSKRSSQQSFASVRETSDILLLGLPEEVLEIEQGLLGRLHVDKGGGDSRLSGTSSTSDLMDVVLRSVRVKVSGGAEGEGSEKRANLNLLRHGEINDMLNLGEIESLGSDTGSDHDVLLARFERLDGVLALLLGCERERRRSAAVREEETRETHSCYREWRQPRLP